MNHRDDIRARLMRVFEETSARAIDASTVTEATPLESFGVDSLVLIDLIFDLEQEFGVKLAAQEMASLRTVGELITHLEQRVPA